MRVDILTKEYPPAIYGGAGVHVAELVRALRELQDARRPGAGVRRAAGRGRVTAYADLPELVDANAALQTLGVDLAIAAGCDGTDLVHSHTWYANLGGHLAGLLYGVPHVVTAHSLEPLRPWKAEQLGGGYAVSSFAERTSYLGAAGGDRGVGGDARRRAARLPRRRPGQGARGAQRDRHRELVARRRPGRGSRAQGVDPDQPSVVFVGRITRQKGLPLFLRGCRALPPDVQLVLCAGAPDTPEIEAEVEGLVDELAQTRDGVVWIREMLPRADVVALLSAATAFVCPSIYEPLGIVNLEAMACETAVVATATGGIPEVVVARRDRAGWSPSSRPPTAPARRWTPSVRRRLRRRAQRGRGDPDRAGTSGRRDAPGRRRHFSWALDRRPDDGRLRAGPRQLTRLCD